MPETQPLHPPVPEISGKKLLPILAVGCLIFIAIGFGGTFLIAKLSAPFFAHNYEEAKKHAADEMKARDKAGRY